LEKIMAFKYSTGLVNKILEQIATDLNGTDGCAIDIYSGTQPADASSKITLSSSVVFLGTITNVNGAALHYSTTAADGVVDKLSTETWQFTAQNTGTATAGFLRIRLASESITDSRTQSDTALRIDGSFGYFGSGDASIENGLQIEGGKIYTVNQCAIRWGA
jgi:hypothetical protein